MGIEEFYPISQPKKLRGPDAMRALPEDKKLVLEAGNNKTRNRTEENTKE